MIMISHLLPSTVQDMNFKLLIPLCLSAMYLESDLRFVFWSTSQCYLGCSSKQPPDLLRVGKTTTKPHRLSSAK